MCLDVGVGGFMSEFINMIMLDGFGW